MKINNAKTGFAGGGGIRLKTAMTLTKA